MLHQNLHDDSLDVDRMTKDYMRNYKIYEVYEHFKLDLQTFMRLSLVETNTIIELCKEFIVSKNKVMNDITNST